MKSKVLDLPQPYAAVASVRANLQQHSSTGRETAPTVGPEEGSAQLGRWGVVSMFWAGEWAKRRAFRPSVQHMKAGRWWKYDRKEVQE